MAGRRKRFAVAGPSKLRRPIMSLSVVAAVTLLVVSEQPASTGHQSVRAVSDAAAIPLGSLLSLPVTLPTLVPPQSTTTMVAPSTSVATPPSSVTSTTVTSPPTTVPSGGGSAGAPVDPPALVCGNASLLNGPASAPPGAVTVPAGDDSGVIAKTWAVSPNTTYWFAPGTHTLGSGQYGQIDPKDGDTFMGAPGAVIDGQGVNQSAFDGTASGVTIEYLTVQNFVPLNWQDVVNHDNGENWTVRYNTLKDNGNVQGSMDGGALGMGSGDVYEYNCLTHNGEYGLNAFGVGTTFANNEVSWNGIAEFPDVSAGSGCGCSGGIKYWTTTNATVQNNYIHDNYNVGLWFDTDNVGALVSGNYIARNWAEALVYEISYNAKIVDNTFLDNTWGLGSYKVWGFPMAAVYINGSSGNPKIDNGRYSTLAVSDNTFTDNWGGVVAYQNPNRVCGTAGNSSTANCTLVNPSVYTTSSCPANVGSSTPSSNPDYYDGCEWPADNISATGNTFTFNPNDIISGTDTLPDITNSHCYSGANYLDTNDSPPTGNAYDCGFNGLFSLYGSAAPYTGWAIPDAIMGLPSASDYSDVDSNHFSSNTYSGPWAFQAYVQGTSPASTDLYPHGVATVVNLNGWQKTWHQN